MTSGVGKLNSSRISFRFPPHRRDGWLTWEAAGIGAAVENQFKVVRNRKRVAGGEFLLVSLDLRIVLVYCRLLLLNLYLVIEQGFFMLPQVSLKLDFGLVILVSVGPSSPGQEPAEAGKRRGQVIMDGGAFPRQKRACRANVSSCLD